MFLVSGQILLDTCHLLTRSVREATLEEKYGLLSAENKHVYLFNDCILFSLLTGATKFDKMLDLHQVKIDDGKSYYKMYLVLMRD